MKQAVLYGCGDLRIEEQSLKIDALEPDQVYVETEVTAFSTGTDLGNYLGDSTYVPGAPDYPRLVGYSNVGVVRKVGKAVNKPVAGQRVFSLRPHQSAYIGRKDNLLIPIPAGVSSEEASLAYLTQLGLAALRQARYETGEHLAVVGLGVIGLCSIWLARAMGAKVVGIAKATSQAEAALRLGAHAALTGDNPHLEQELTDIFGDVGVDIVILTANPWSAYRLSMEIVRRGGRVSILGFPGRQQPPPDFNPLDPRWIYDKQLMLLGAGAAPQTECCPQDIRFNLRRNLNYIFELMASHRPRIESVITHRFPASRMCEAYELAKGHAKDLGAAIFDWRSAGEI